MTPERRAEIEAITLRLRCFAQKGLSVDCHAIDKLATVIRELLYDLSGRERRTCSNCIHPSMREGHEYCSLWSTYESRGMVWCALIGTCGAWKERTP
jgi:hypothetical protein